MLSKQQAGALYVHLTKEFCMRSTSVKASKVIVASALLAAAAFSVNAHASDVRWNVSIGLPFPVVVQPAPVYYPPPQVVYQQPQVVYTQPQVVYTQPQVVYTQPQVVYPQPRVVVAPRQVVYGQPGYYGPQGHWNHGHRGQHGQPGHPGYGQVVYYNR
jgi:hypothetical protein